MMSIHKAREQRGMVICGNTLESRVAWWSVGTHQVSLGRSRLNIQCCWHCFNFLQARQQRQKQIWQCNALQSLKVMETHFSIAELRLQKMDLLERKSLKCKLNFSTLLRIPHLNKFCSVQSFGLVCLSFTQEYCGSRSRVPLFFISRMFLTSHP